VGRWFLAFCWGSGRRRLASGGSRGGGICRLVSLFPWTMSDFSLMDAIECGIVKLPRVPVAENIPGDEMPMFRDLWENIRKDMPKKGRGQGEELDPLKLPLRLQTALEALYGHYEKTFKLWEEKSIKVPPCFIIVCQNTAISKLVYEGTTRGKQNGRPMSAWFAAVLRAACVCVVTFDAWRGARSPVCGSTGCSPTGSAATRAECTTAPPHHNGRGYVRAWLRTRSRPDTDRSARETILPENRALAQAWCALKPAPVAPG